MLLIGGDAGIGKSALIGYLTDQARGRGFRVLQGACLDISDNVPVRPVLEALRPALEDASGPSGARLAQILGDGAPTESLMRGEMFNLLRRVVDELAATPLVLVLEDMHWSDQSSRDFALTLSASLPAHAVVALTFRSDDLHRRHPFRSCLVDLARAPCSRHLDLGPLDRAGLDALIDRRTGGPVDPALVAAVVERSEGNPLYAEELIERARDHPELPTRLSDLLLHRVDSLSEPTRSLLRCASVCGSRLDEGLVATVMSAGADEVEPALRESLDFNVLARRGEHLEFRHGLIREAVYDDLLPGEKERFHARFAAALQEQEEGSSRTELGRLSQLAFHWYEAHDLPAALAASLQAGLVAKHYGTSEAVHQLDRVLALWDQVPDASTRTGLEKSDVLRVAAEAAFEAEDFHRARQLIESALELIGPDTDPLVASRVHASYYLSQGGTTRAEWTPGTIDIAEAVDRAVAFAGSDASDELAMALAVQARQRWHYGRFVEAGQIAARAIEVARAVDNPRAEAEAREALGGMHTDFGRFAEGRAEYARAVLLRRDSGFGGAALFAEVDRAAFDLKEGEVERCVAISRACAARARELGQDAIWFFGLEQEWWALQLDGRLDEADVVLRELYESREFRDRWNLLMATQLQARGDRAALELMRPEIVAHASFGGWALPETLFSMVAVLLDAGHVSEASELVSKDLLLLERDHPPMHEAAILLCGFATLAAARSAGQALPDEFAVQLQKSMDVQEATWDHAWDPTWYGAMQATARAWASRTRQRPDPDCWATAVDLWTGLQMRMLSITYSVELADDLLGVGRRDEAREVLLRTWAAARSSGMKGVATRTGTLARRHRITLPDHAPELGRLAHLTPREREVLDILMTGASNKVIAGRLFISEKTVSVHVSNLLAKLGVSSRGEAAALAREVLGA